MRAVHLINSNHLVYFFVLFSNADEYLDHKQITQKSWYRVSQFQVNVDS